MPRRGKKKTKAAEEVQEASSGCDVEETSALLASMFATNVAEEEGAEEMFGRFEDDIVPAWTTPETAAEFWENVVAETSFAKTRGCRGVSGLIDIVASKLDGDNSETLTEKWMAMRAYFCCLRVPGAIPFRAFDAALFSKALSLLQQWGAARAKDGVAARKRKRGSAEPTAGDAAGEEDVVSSSLVEAVVENLRSCMETAVASAVASDMEMLPVAVDAIIDLAVGSFAVKCSSRAEESSASILARIASITPSGGVADEGHCERVVLKKILPLILMSKPASTTQTQMWALDVAAKLFSISENEAVIATTLLQHVCFRVSDKTSGRAIAAASIDKILTHISEGNRSSVFQKFCAYIVKMGTSPKIPQRTFATEAAFTLFSMSHHDPALLSQEQQSEEEQEEQNEEAAPRIAEALLSEIAARCSDRAPTVRVAAIRGVRKLLELIIESAEGDFAAFENTIRLAVAHVCERINDEKSGVRRAALFVANLILQHGDMAFARGSEETPGGILGAMAIAQKQVEDVARRVNDTSLLVRKLAMECVHAAWKRYPRCPALCEMWVKSILPSTRDTEASVQKKSLELLHNAIFEDILGDRSDETSAWHLMPHLCEETTSCLKHALCMLSRDQKYPLQNLIVSLSDVASSSMDSLFGSVDETADVAAILGAATGSWTLLGFFCARPLSAASNAEGKMAAPDALLIKAGLEHLDGAFATEAFLRVLELGSSATVHQLLSRREEAGAFVGSMQSRVLDVFAGSAHRLSKHEATKMSDRLLKSLSSMIVPESQVQQYVDTLAALTIGSSDKKQALEEIRVWGLDLISVCADKLREYVTAPNAELAGDVYASLVLVGSVVMLGFDVHDAKAAIVPIEGDIVHLVQSLLPAHFPQCEEEIPCGVRAHAFVCVGKLCLRSRDVAKTTVLPLVRELAVCPHSILRSNILIVLGDLCRCYTNTIDAHLDTIAASLNDVDPLVRRHAIIIISGLLQEDYIKWRSSLLFRYLACTSDSDVEIASLSRHALAAIFLKKTPTLFQVNFIECMFVFADCADHPKYNASDFFNVNTPSKVQLHQLEPVSSHFNRRMAIYDFMLQNMNDVHKLEVVGKLCRVVLGGVLDGVIKLAGNDGAGSHRTLLEDAFAVLALPSIRCKLPNANRQSAADAEEAIADAEAMSASQEKTNALDAARSKVMAKLARQTVQDKIVPLLASLYRKMQREHSPMVKNVMDYVISLHKDFKTEVMDGLKCDLDMAREVEFDIRQREKRAEEERLRAEAKALEEEQNESAMDEDDDNEEECSAAKTPAAKDFKTPRASRSAKKLAVSNLRISTCKSSTKALARTPRAALTPIGIMSHEAIGALSGRTPEVTVKSAPRLKRGASSDFYDDENANSTNDSGRKATLRLKMKTPSSLRLKSIMKKARSEDEDGEERPAKVARVSFGSLGSLPTPK